ncbi:hypothetical protein SAMN02799631_03250 [Methylobacterium sp. 174MFSha1.1]|uniref:hypothetical protein n=1 Tax=Methylobacterium sp. 174MFSha1.1 TaxID=1502749 RepID=UPI0008F21FDA|nr:hypothetical protein [Methylobacterium sp. 174MFSha1.1]SFU93531.1 hypothetical protein SAMN02799631_03250 [Methylobacterium sp. 174MFSha1.1]
MASEAERYRAAWDLYRIPQAAQIAFRRRVVEARCEEPDALAAFAAVGVSNVMRPPVLVYDDVAVALAALPEDARPAIEVPLLGQALTAPTAAGLMREALARGLADGLDDRQLAGAISVVLESHGLLAREAA